MPWPANAGRPGPGRHGAALIVLFGHQVADRGGGLKLRGDGGAHALSERLEPGLMWPPCDGSGPGVAHLPQPLLAAELLDAADRLSKVDLERLEVAEQHGRRCPVVQKLGLDPVGTESALISSKISAALFWYDRPGRCSARARYAMPRLRDRYIGINSACR